MSKKIGTASLLLTVLTLPIAFFATPRDGIAQETPESSGAAGKAIIILDASGSMWGQIEGRAKIEIARDVIADLLGSLDPGLQLGLVAYGHRRKGDCADIELLIPPGKVDRQAFLERVLSLVPVGKTPLSDAVERSANYLKFEENPASVILVSDGIETCDRDPCVLARDLAARGIAFKAHIVAFDLTSKEAETIRCLADETGGRFLQAQDARTLKDALQMAVEAASEPVTAAPLPEEILDPATLKAPPGVPAGSEFEVQWEGPDNKGDYLTIVPKGAEDRDFGNYAYTVRGNPATLTATMTPGPHEIRYMAARSRKVLGRTDIEVTPISGTVSAPAEVVAGSYFPVEWTGPANRGDYLTIVPAGAEEKEFTHYAYTRQGSPARIRALSEAGKAEVRYITGQKGKILARTPLTVLPAIATVSGPEKAGAGSEVPIEFIGPANQGDYITIVEAGAAEGRFKHYAYPKHAEDGKLKVKAPEATGPHEIRYIAGAGGKTLASAPIELTAMTATLKAPPAVVAGSEFQAEWTGPANAGDFITVVPKSAKPKEHGNYFYPSRSESPGTLTAPESPGEGEIRYVTAGGKHLAVIPVRITAATASLEAPESVPAGSSVRVKWAGPANRGDLIAIVPKGAGPKELKLYTYVREENPVEVEAIETVGPAEVRYLSAKDRKILASAPLEITAVSAKLLLPEEMPAKDNIEISWEGPNNNNDVVCIVPPDAPAKQINNYVYCRNGSPQKVRTPAKPGVYEARYVTGRERKILAKQKVTITGEE